MTPRETARDIIARHLPGYELHFALEDAITAAIGAAELKAEVRGYNKGLENAAFVAYPPVVAIGAGAEPNGLYDRGRHEAANAILRLKVTV
jgi:triosephosphate isomerase